MLALLLLSLPNTTVAMIKSPDWDFSCGCERLGWWNMVVSWVGRMMKLCLLEYSRMGSVKGWSHSSVSCHDNESFFGRCRFYSVVVFWVLNGVELEECTYVIEEDASTNCRSAEVTMRLICRVWREISSRDQLTVHICTPFLIRIIGIAYQPHSPGLSHPRLPSN